MDDNELEKATTEALGRITTMCEKSKQQIAEKVERLKKQIAEEARKLGRVE